MHEGDLLKAIFILLHAKGVLTDDEYAAISATTVPGCRFQDTVDAIRKITEVS